MAWTPPPHDPKVELRDHLPDESWGIAVREISARHGIDGTDAAPFASGSDVVWSAGEHVVKLTAPRWCSEIAAEARSLGLVAGRLSVRTPEPVATGEIAGWPYVVMGKIPGVAIGSIWGELERKGRERLATDLGALTRELHGVPAEDTEDDGWDAFWHMCRDQVGRRHTEPGVPKELAASVDAFLDSVGDLEPGPLVLLHTELLGEHVLVEERGGRFELAGLIDFADGRVGPAEYEFPAPVEFLFRGERGLLRAYLSAYGLPEKELVPGRAERLLAWGLSHRFGRLLRMLRAVEPARPRDLPELARLLYDPS